MLSVRRVQRLHHRECVMAILYNIFTVFFNQEMKMCLSDSIYSRVFEVQGIFQYLIGIYPACTIGHVDKRI